MASSTGAAEKKAAKELGWDRFSLTTKKGFEGAVQAFTSSTGSKVALCFNLHEAFIVKDDIGLFDVDDLYNGIVKDSDIDIEDSGDIEGVKLVAWEEDGEVTFNEDLAKELGIDTFEVEDDIRRRLIVLAALDQQTTIQ